MDNDLINSQGDGPIARATASDRMAVFNTNANSIYNKFTPYTDSGIGPSQPFVYTKISDSTFSKNLTRYDTYAAPIGSTVRDVKRIGQYLVTGTGILYVGKQLILQNQNAFNETRIYNPLSVLKAVAKPGSLGAIDYPVRHLETSGGIVNFFKDALMSTLGFVTKDAEKPRIDGTAIGLDNGVAYSTYAGFHGGARAGLLRYDTATKASAKFSEAWVTNPSQGGTNGGFLSNLASGLINSLKRMIPSTNPLGAFGGSAGETWRFRPEYQQGKDGAYYAFLSDNSGFLTVSAPASQLFYNDGRYASANAASKSTVLLASNYHKYYPQKQDDKNSRVWYANKTKISQDSVGVEDEDGNQNNLKSLHERMVESIDSFKNESNQFRKSAERYSEVKDNKGFSYSSYEEIPSGTGDIDKFETAMRKANGVVILDDKMFAKNSTYQGGATDASDEYNALSPIYGERGIEPNELLQDGPNQSRDLIFFYFYDLINEIYVPFRATIKGLSDQHQADWEEISYIGRADKLFLYKGFSRDVNFAFTVYANSAIEMIPMWERINYLVGLTRPSKYTGAPAVERYVSTATTETLNTALTEARETGDEGRIQQITEELNNRNYAEGGREGKFIYPPMTTFRLGDLYVDQPCIISSVGVNVSDDANWETLRDDKYSYVASPTKEIKIDGVKSRQLPLQVEVSVTLKILEKALSLGSNAHYGRTTYKANGSEDKRWLL